MRVSTPHIQFPLGTPEGYALLGLDRVVRVLFVEDNPRDADLVCREIQRAGLPAECTRVDNEIDYLLALEGNVDLVLSDYSLPSFEGPRALELLKARRPEVPFILISGSVGEEAAVQMMKQGAADYLLKDRLGRLGQAMRQALAQSHQRREQLSSHERLREQAEMLDRAQDAILVLELASRRIRYWNQGAGRVYGWTDAEAVGRTYREIFPEAAAQESIFTELQQTGQWQGEFRISARNGAKRLISSQASLLPMRAGQPVQALFIDRDVTSQRSLEQQFARSQRMQSLGTLAGGVAHDLNNVLAPILMGVQLLRTEQGEQNAALLSTMEASCLRGASLIKQVLAFARGVEVERRPLNPLETLAEVAKVVRDTFPKRIDFQYDVDPGAWSVLGDSTQLHQVVMNLCVNARDAMPNGGRLLLTASNAKLDDIFSSLNPGAQPGPHLLVQVSDTGTGMTPDVRERIFDPFFTTKEAGHGTGLGLSTSLAIVQSHGGFLNVYSELGRGTTFKVYLPAITTARAEIPNASAQVDLPRGNNQLILVADDEEAIQQVAQKTLERFGYRVLLATHGAEAVGLYAQYRTEVAAVLTDMEMPILDGPATIMALQAVNPEVKIICSSGLGAGPSVSKALDAGVTHFIPKPYTAESMLTTLAKVLGER